MRYQPFEELLGRFELINPASNTRKFWSCERDFDGTYLVSWGRIGTKGSCKGGLDRFQAEERIREKMEKGYRHVGGFRSVQERKAKEIADAIGSAGVGVVRSRARM